MILTPVLKNSFSIFFLMTLISCMRTKTFKSLENTVNAELHKLYVCRRGSRGGEMGEFSLPPPFSEPPFFFLFLIPQPGFGSITLLQKFTPPRFKILDPRLVWLTSNKLTLDIKKKSNFVIFRPYQKRLSFQPKISIFDNEKNMSVPLDYQDYVSRNIN